MVHGPKPAVIAGQRPALSADKPLAAEFGLDLIADKTTIILIIPVYTVLHLWMPNLSATLSPAHSAFCDLPFLVTIFIFHVT